MVGGGYHTLKHNINTCESKPDQRGRTSERRRAARAAAIRITAYIWRIYAYGPETFGIRPYTYRKLLYDYFPANLRLNYGSIRLEHTAARIRSFQPYSAVSVLITYKYPRSHDRFTVTSRSPCVRALEPLETRFSSLLRLEITNVISQFLTLGVYVDYLYRLSTI